MLNLEFAAADCKTQLKGKDISWGGSSIKSSSDDFPKIITFSQVKGSNSEFPYSIIYILSGLLSAK